MPSQSSITSRGNSEGSYGTLFIVSAPSGAGKTTLCNALRRHFVDLAYSVSHTTREPRPNEKNGQDYFFISREEFEQGIADGVWAEWAQVHGHHYGTSAQWIIAALDDGTDVLMDIDVQGTRQMVQRFPEAITIFIMPPSMAVLEERLRQRGAEDDATIALRMANAREEMAQKTIYRHVLVNDDLETAIDQLISIVQTYCCKSPFPDAMDH